MYSQTRDYCLERPNCLWYLRITSTCLQRPPCQQLPLLYVPVGSYVDRFTGIHMLIT